MMSQTEGHSLILELQKPQPPHLYRVVMLNDDISTQDFVIRVLTEIFHKPFSQATQLTLEVHNNGSAVIGVYPHDIARTRVRITDKLAQKKGFPLCCLVEKNI